MTDGGHQANMRNERAIMVAISLVITVLAAWRATASVTFNDDLSLERVTEITTNLLFVALLIERALEVFITAYTAPDRAVHTSALERTKHDVEEAEKGQNKDEIAAAKAASLEARAASKRFKARTQVTALQASVVLGLLTSAVGYRVLAQIVNPEPLSGLGASGFVFIDVLLTGGLLAGGSKGIHSVTQLFGSYLDLLTENARTSTPSGNPGTTP